MSIRLSATPPTFKSIMAYKSCTFDHRKNSLEFSKGKMENSRLFLFSGQNSESILLIQGIEAVF